MSSGRPSLAERSLRQEVGWRHRFHEAVLVSPHIALWGSLSKKSFRRADLAEQSLRKEVIAHSNSRYVSTYTKRERARFSKINLKYFFIFPKMSRNIATWFLKTSLEIAIDVSNKVLRNQVWFFDSDRILRNEIGLAIARVKRQWQYDVTRLVISNFALPNLVCQRT